ncbi:beta-galactosidase [Modestobacter sp. I12A-02628]|uniref:Beta-galactosidase n=1 Tax=Goekera deserti TaxID=2497753 RepID=A0A7K3WBH8_9ACTN|nr:beta-galactosidase [Goekera deserti]MPQ97470.1 beta-galactosidase [Goekera deserti]NDI47929.1 beta-galactosidase [Goekera deserti]NEL53677.1 beta-galactosidase [Goekera deserti]
MSVARPAAGRWPTDSISFGGDYNPEQWSPEVWVEDVALMREAGVDLVTVGVFSWALLEPEPGRYEFGWLDQVLDLLHAGGIRVDLATATASAPPWLARLHPEVLPVAEDGTRYAIGGRQTWCPSSPVYRERSLLLVEQLAARYGQHPALAMWHVSNELGCHNVHCFCDVSATAFRAWLQRRYGTGEAGLAELNRAWGTAFWSQHYGDWAEVGVPRRTTATGNPTQRLDFLRFSSDALLEQYEAEASVLRRVTPEVPVTTNFMVTSHQWAMDYGTWAAGQDVVSNDHYLDHRLPDPHAELSFCADLTRGLAGGGPWLLMEQATSAVNWQPVNVAKRPGETLRDSLVHVARGADGVCFFQWRASVAGAEKYHSALLPHAGTRTRLWREVRELGRALRSIDEVRGTRVQADVAQLFDHQAWWACDAPNRPSELMGYTDAGRAVHRALRAAGVTSDVVPVATPDLAGVLAAHRVVVVPTLHLCTDATAAAVADAAAAGATVVVTCSSGIVDEDDHVRPGGYPGAFADLTGVRMDQFHPLPAGERLELENGWAGTVWSEEGTVDDDVEVVARVTAGPLPGQPAVTRRPLPGGGAAWYVATQLDDASWAALLDRVLQEVGVGPAAVAPAGVEVVRRVSADGERSYLFCLDHTGAEQRVAARGVELITGATVDGEVTVPARGAAVVRETAG